MKKRTKLLLAVVFATIITVGAFLYTSKSMVASDTGNDPPPGCVYIHILK